MAIPKLALAYLATFVGVTSQYWSGATEPWRMAALVERESNWKIHAELKTSREYGFGFSQTTIAYNKDGTERFNRYKELKQNFKELSGWKWEDRFDPKMHFLAITLSMQKLVKRFEGVADTKQDAWRMAASSYNGGSGDVLKSVMACKKIEGCRPGTWFSNVETHLNKSRIKWHGYGQSAYDINTGYVRFIENRAPDYREAWIQNERQPSH